MSNRFVVFVLGIVLLVFVSCGSYKKIPYLSDLSDSAFVYRHGSEIKMSPKHIFTIQPKDLLSISIIIKNPNSPGTISLVSVNNTKILSVKGSASMTESTDNKNNIFEVSNNGYLSLPLVGTFYVQGMTSDKLHDLIYNSVSKEYLSPYVSVDIISHHITVLGEVNNPGTYAVRTPEDANIWNILGLAGDISIYGRRENVIVMRKNGTDSTLTVYRINLNSTNVFSSPVFQLQPNDIVYVEPSKRKASQLDNSRLQLITILTSIISLGFVVFYARR